jgi:hypothetical protein
MEVSAVGGEEKKEKEMERRRRSRGEREREEWESGEGVREGGMKWRGKEE